MRDNLHRYSLADYGGMLRDPTRVGAYQAALEALVKPECVVLEMGTGAGTFALLAAKLGARKVYALEPNPTVLVAREIAARNGLDDRITFLQDVSTNVELSEKADVILSDMRGVTPFFEHHLPAIFDARLRLLAPGGHLIPREDRLYGALLESPKAYRDVVGPWGDAPLGIDMEPARKLAVHSFGRTWVEVDAFLSPPTAWCTLDYRTLTSPSAEGTMELRVARSGTAHGLVIWFDTVLADGVGYSNAPGQPRNLYGQMFLPFERAIPVDSGDVLDVRLRARYVFGDYVWLWDTQAHRPGRESIAFTQSTFDAAPAEADSIRRRDWDYAGGLNDEGRHTLEALRELAEGASVGQVARGLAARHGDAFRSRQEAHTFVADLTARFGI